jgi:uncharacterized repeat protein (TIGR03803 family)
LVVSRLGGITVVLGGVLALTLANWSPAQAQNYSVLYSFQCEPNDGDGPYGNLIADSTGDLYGTTTGGGNLNLGTVFELSASGTESVLHSFAGSPGDGAEPYAGLVRDSAGNLYGTTFYGGTTNAAEGGDGTVFEVFAAGAESVLYNFGSSNADGMWPRSTLLRDQAGNLYGTATAGPGIGQDGTIFKVSAVGKETVLYRFGGGGGPSAGLTRSSAGDFYGTTLDGGSSRDGTVFEFTKAGQSVLHDFRGSPTDGAGPAGPLLRDPAGNLYGTTLYGGQDAGCEFSNDVGCGTVFKVTAEGTETALLSFDDQAGGAEPEGNLVEDKNGNLYGIAAVGGSFTCSQIGCGVVFEVTTDGKAKVLHQFAGPPSDGEEPYGGLLQVGNALYGTTLVGGANGCGTVFKITP